MSLQSKRVGAIILAAGESSRFGRPKQLVKLEGKPLVRRVADAALAANCSPVIVVTGNAAGEVKRVLRATNAIIVENKEWKKGIGTSIRAGIEYLTKNAPNVDAAVLLTCDQPFVDADVLNRLITLHFKTKKPIVASAYADTLGIPALFERSIFPELLLLRGSSGAKPVILSNRERVAEFPFPKGNVDVDTIEDFESIIQRR
jgi:molybdenum cofactor cytidylyltransferase